MTARDSDVDTHESAGGPASMDETLASFPGSDHRVEIEPGTRIDRYVVSSRLGSGAMGVVLAAHDPKLDRQVALKVLRPRGTEEQRIKDQARLQREAQALAKLAHPNVVGVHDVGTHGGRVFVAMEYVEGQTLGAWLAARPDLGWRATLSTFAQAGEGLAAAHAAGLVHRDFKPDNVMVDGDGRVRVMDFGLARGDGVPLDGPPSFDGDDSASLRLTRTGALMGTPAYMSPEQFVGAVADARSDQFSFCAALYEALYGERAFGGPNLGALALAVSAGEIRPAPRGATVPLWVRRAVVRGLANTPASRHPDMRALLTALADDPAISRRRVAIGSVLALSLGAGAWGLTRPTPAAGAHTAPCAELEGHLVGVWDEGVRQTMRTSITSAAPAIAEATLARVEPRADAWANEWVTHRRDVCEATRVRAEQSEAVMDLRMGCLDRRLDTFAATIEVLVSADAAVAKKAVNLMAGLPGSTHCDDLDALRSAVPLPDDPARADAVRAARSDLARVTAMGRAGRYDPAAEMLQELTPRVEVLDYGPLNAETMVRRGIVRDGQAKHDDAVPLLVEGYQLAMQHRMLEVGADAATHMIFLLDTLGRRVEARVWGVHAESIARAAGSDRLVGRALVHRGTVEHTDGKPELALESYQRALDFVTATFGEDDPMVASALTGLGNVASDDGDFELSARHFQRAISIYETQYGPEHPHVGSLLDNLGWTARSLGNLGAARAHFTRARGIFESALGPTHPHTSFAISGLGDVAFSEGDWTEAHALFSSAYSIRKTAYGEASQWIVPPLMKMGMVEIRLGRLAEAREHLELSLSVREGAQGEEHPQVAEVCHELGVLALAENQTVAALELHRRGLAISLAANGEEHLDVASARIHLADALVAAGDSMQAMRELELAEPHIGQTQRYRGLFAFARAKARWAAGERASAVRDANQAHAALTGAGEKAQAAVVSDWIAGHAPG